MKPHKLHLALMAVFLSGAAGVVIAGAEIEGAATTVSKPVPKDINISQDALDKADGNNTNWIHSNMSYSNSRYYPADQINTGNVAKLKPAFVFQTAVLESMETSPLVIDGVMFLTTSYNHVYAIDAVTGELPMV